MTVLLGVFSYKKVIGTFFLAFLSYDVSTLFFQQGDWHMRFLSFLHFSFLFQQREGICKHGLSCDISAFFSFFPAKGQAYASMAGKRQCARIAKDRLSVRTTANAGLSPPPYSTDTFFFVGTRKYKRSALSAQPPTQVY